MEPGLRDFARTFVDAYDKRYAEKLATAKCEADRPELNSAVSVRLLSSRVVPDSMEAAIFNKQHFEFAILNNSARTLIGVAGNVGLVDVFGKTIGSFEMEITETLRPHAEHGWEFKRVTRAHSTDKEDRLWELKDGRFKVEFVPETIVFEGGRTLRRHC